MPTTIITTDGVYTPTTRTRALRVKAWGAGGGGAGGNTADGKALSGGAGGGGAATLFYLDVRRGGAIVITIGQGGAAGAVATDGANGGDTVVQGIERVVIPGGKAGVTLPRVDGTQGGQGGQGVARLGMRTQRGGNGATWTERLLYSRGPGGGAGAALGLPGLNGGIPAGGHNFFAPGQGGDGGRGADPDVASAGLTLTPAHAGFVQGGGGGAGCAVVPVEVTVGGFDGSASGGTIVGAFQLFDYVMVADWHSLVLSPEWSTIPGLGFSITILDATPVVPTFSADVSFDGLEIHLQGVIPRFVTVTVSGECWATSAGGAESNHATWSWAVTGT